MSNKKSVALVTGAAHRLGREIALALARHGYDLMLHYHASADQADTTLHEIADLDVEVDLFAADLREPLEIRRLFDQVSNRFGQLDVLVNSAAIMQRRDFKEIEVAEWDRTININLRAPFLCIQEAARIMERNQGGCVINISDIAGRRPWAKFPVHSISKAGIEMLTQVAALALAPSIRVNAVAPGPVLKPDQMSTNRWDDLGAQLPLGRVGKPEDVVEAVMFLIQNPLITGETFVVDGGYQVV